MEIKNKRVVVTGAASGIGKALCEEFFASGVKSLVCVDTVSYTHLRAHET